MTKEQKEMYNWIGNMTSWKVAGQHEGGYEMKVLVLLILGLIVFSGCIIGVKYSGEFLCASHDGEFLEETGYLDTVKCRENNTGKVFYLDFTNQNFTKYYLVQDCACEQGSTKAIK